MAGSVTWVNTMSSEKRKYEQKARAEGQRETRAAIAKAAAELHEEKGVAATSVSEIARRAGVTRLTVYNHFADLSELLPACSAHYAQLHPTPDLEPILAIEEPGRRVREALAAMYAWYRETRHMLEKLFSDRTSVPELDEFMKGDIDVAPAALADALGEGFGAKGRHSKRLNALLRLSLDFWTWHRLNGQGLDDAGAADLMTAAVLNERA